MMFMTQQFEQLRRSRMLKGMQFIVSPLSSRKNSIVDERVFI